MNPILEYPRIVYAKPVPDKELAYIEVANADEHALRYAQGYRFNPAGEQLAPPAGYKEPDKAKAKA